MSDQFDDIVNSAFEGGMEHESAPDGIWQKLDKELVSSSIDNQVKESFESLSEKAPESVWEKVQDQMDIDHTWKKIAQRLTIRRVLHFSKYASLFLLLLIPFNLDYSDLKVEDGKAMGEMNAVLSSDLTTANEILKRAENKNASRNVNTDDAVIATSAEIQQVHDEPVKVNEYQQTGTTVAIAKQQSEDNDLDNDWVRLEPGQLGLLSVSDLNRGIISQTFKTPRKKLGLIAGVTTSLEHTRLMDNDARMAYNRYSLVENKVRLGGSFGLFLDYRFNRSYTLTGEFLFHNQINEAHNFYNEGGVYSIKEREVNLNKYSLMLSRIINTRFNRPNQSAIVRLGGYAATVKSDYTSVNGVLNQVNSIYKRTDLGLRFELAEQFYLKSFVIEAGVKSDFGLTNLAPDDNKIPAHLNYTRAISYGGYLRIGYMF